LRSRRAARAAAARARPSATDTLSGFSTEQRHPAARLAYVLGDAAAPVILAEAGTEGALLAGSARVVLRGL